MIDSKAALIAKIGAGAAAAAIAVVFAWEGERRVAYRDPLGVLTACVGHTGPDVKPGWRYTAAECQALLHDDLLKHAEALDCVKAPMKEGERAAFLSFAFNVGAKKFCASTLVRRANAGDMAGACAELSRWVGGYNQRGEFVRLRGLVERRAVERRLCETGTLG